MARNRYLKVLATIMLTIAIGSTVIALFGSNYPGYWIQACVWFSSGWFATHLTHDNVW